MRPRLLARAHASMRASAAVRKPLAAGGVDPLEQRAPWIVEREEVDEPDVLQHLGRAVPREASSCAEDREQRRDRVGAEAAQRVLGRGSHPPPLVGQQANERGRGLGPDDVACGARGVHADEPLAVVQTRDQRGADGRPPSGSRASRRRPHGRSGRRPT